MSDQDAGLPAATDTEAAAAIVETGPVGPTHPDNEPFVERVEDAAKELGEQIAKIAHKVGDAVRHLFASDETHEQGVVQTIHANGEIDVLVAGGQLVTAPAHEFQSIAAVDSAENQGS